MEVILTSKIKNLGDVGDIVQVRAGYARNYLVPYGKAQFATEENRKAFEARRAEYEKKVAAERQAARERAEKLKAIELTVVSQVVSDNKLYGPISNTKVAELASRLSGVEIQRQEVSFPDGQVRTVGEHKVVFYLHSDVSVETKLTVISDSAEQQQEDEIRTSEEVVNPVAGD